MTDPWKPSNDLEVALSAAVDRGDLESYLHMLRTATVVVPTTDPRPEAGWLVKMVDGLPHAAVFTSTEARLTDPTARGMQELQLTMAELAKVWPDPARRLAVNPGLSIGVYLPATYLLSTGTRLGAADPRRVLSLPDLALDGYQDIRTGTFATENRTEQDLLAAIAAGDGDEALRCLLSATLFLVSTEKDGFTAPGEAGFRWLTIGADERRAVPVFTSRNRVDQGLRHNTYTKLPVRLLDLADAWPNDELSLVVNPGTSLTVLLPGPGVLGLPELAEQLGISARDSTFRPAVEPDQAQFDAAAVGLTLRPVPGTPVESATEEENALLAAVAAGDRAAYLRTLLGMTLRLSTVAQTDPAVRFAGHQLDWQPVELGGAPVLPVFTSPRRHREGGGTGRSSAEADKLLRHWPNPAWDLAINPGTPLAAVLPGSQVAALSAWYDQLQAYQLGQSFPVGERIDMQLVDAARRGDRAAFLEILRPAKVFVGTTEKGLPSTLAPTDPAFPWQPVPVRGRPSVLVYTTTAWRMHAGGSGGTVRVALSELASAWPAGGPDLVLNPASPISLTLAADEVRAFGQGQD